MKFSSFVTHTAFDAESCQHAANTEPSFIEEAELGGGEDPEILIPRIPTISKETSLIGGYYLCSQSLDKSGLLSFFHGYIHSVKSIKYVFEYVMKGSDQANLYVGFSRNGNPDTTHVYDRPDVLCRVFNQKQKELLKDIKERELLGKYKALLSVIEFQKRGAPHAHTLVG